MTTPRPIEATTVIDAPVDDVWRLVSDVARMSEWSPECRRIFVLDRGEGLRPGSLLIGINRRGAVVWPTRSRIVRLEPPQAVAWKTLESGATWTYELEPVSDGTRVTARRDLSRYSFFTRLGAPLIGGAVRHDDELADGLRATLERIKAEVEGQGPDPSEP